MDNFCSDYWYDDNIIDCGLKINSDEKKLKQNNNVNIEINNNEFIKRRNNNSIKQNGKHDRGNKNYNQKEYGTRPKNKRENLYFGKLNKYKSNQYNNLQKPFNTNHNKRELYKLPKNSTISERRRETMLDPFSKPNI